MVLDMIKKLKKRALHRTKILQGQTKGLEKMIEDEDYCMDILTQSLSIQKSLRSLNKLILENHLQTHVKQKLKAQNSKLKGKKNRAVIRELLDLYELSSVRT